MLPATLLHLNERSNIWAPSTVPIWVKTNKRNMLRQSIMCKSYTKRMIASQSCCSKLSPSGQCGCLCPAYDAVCNQPADLRRLRPKLPQVGTKPSNLKSRRWACIYIEIFIFIRHIVRYCTRAYQDCLCRTIRRNSMAEVGQWPPLSI